MVDEKQCGIVRRQPLIVMFGNLGFHGFVLSLLCLSCSGPIGTVIACAVHLQVGGGENTLLLGSPYRSGILGAMELRHLRYFVAVAEEQNVSRAAVRLHVSQPPLSRQIRNLEDELGISLFEHGAKSIRLTEAGRAFLIEARMILQRIECATQVAKD